MKYINYFIYYKIKLFHKNLLVIHYLINLMNNLNKILFINKLIFLKLKNIKENVKQKIFH